VAERLFGRLRPGRTLGEQQCSGRSSSGFAGAADPASTPLAPSPPLPSSTGKIEGPRADLALSQPPPAPGVARRQAGELRRATLLVEIGPPPEMRRTSSTAAWMEPARRHLVELRQRRWVARRREKGRGAGAGGCDEWRGGGWLEVEERQGVTEGISAMWPCFTIFFIF
jgi:hypothetical protein